MRHWCDHLFSGETILRTHILPSCYIKKEKERTKTKKNNSITTTTTTTGDHWSVNYGYLGSFDSPFWPPANRPILSLLLFYFLHHFFTFLLLLLLCVCKLCDRRIDDPSRCCWRLLRGDLSYRGGCGRLSWQTNNIRPVHSTESNLIS